MTLTIVDGIDASIAHFLEDAAINGRLCFFTGSGVSLFKPSNLPSGKELESVFLHCLLEGYTLDKEVSDALESDIINAIPLEQCFQEAETSGCVDLLTALEFLKGPNTNPVFFNPLHETLAMWQSHYGGVILTTNFDLLHEQAFQKITGKKIERCFDETTAFELKDYLERMRLSTNTNALIKLHGSIDSHPSMRATLLRVGRELEPGLSQLFSHYRENCHLCIIGYSGSDPDIEPILSESSNYNLIIVVQPPFSNDVESLKLGVYGKRILSQCEGYAIVCDIRDFLSTFVDRLALSSDLANRIKDLPNPTSLGDTRLHWESWSRLQSEFSRKLTLARVFLGATDTSNTIKVLGSLFHSVSLSIAERIHLLWLKGMTESLAHHYREARRIFRQCCALAVGPDHELVRISCEKEIAFQDYLLNKNFKAWLRLRKLEVKCRSCTSSPDSINLGFSSPQLLVETFINRIQVELTKAKYLPPILRKHFLKRKSNQLNDALIRQNELGVLDIKANLLSLRARINKLLGQLDQAEEDFKNAITIYYGLGRVITGVAHASGALADLYIETGKLEQAEVATLKAIQIATEEGFHLGLARHYRRLTKIKMLQDDDTEAKKALKLMRRSGNHLKGLRNGINFRAPEWLLLRFLELDILKDKLKRRP